MNEHNNNQNRRTEYSYSDLRGFHRAVPILLAAVAVIIFAGYLTEDTGFGHTISMIFQGLFAAGAWAIPVLLIIHAIFYAEDLGRGRIVSRIIFSVITVLVISVIQYAIVFWDSWKDAAVFDPVRFFVEENAGGFIGSIFAFLLIKVFGPVGLIILAVAVAALYVVFFYAGTNNTVGKVFLRVLEVIASGLAVVERWIVGLIGKGKDIARQRKQKQIEERQAELADDEFFRVDNGMQRMEIKELGIRESKDPDEIEQNPTLHSKVYMKSAVSGEDARIIEKEEAPKPKTAPEAKPETKFRDFNFDYNLDHLKNEPKTEEVKSEVKPEPQKTQRESFGLDEKAENVFTKDFDPFDFHEAETIASRKSSRAPIREKIAPIFGEAVDLDELTEEDVKRIREKEALAKKMAEQKLANDRRRLEFEQRKAQIVNQYKAQNTAPTAPTQESAPRVSTTYSTPTFTDYSSHSAKEDIFAVKEQKARERAAEAESREPEMSYSNPIDKAPAYNAPSYTQEAYEAPSYEAKKPENTPVMETKVYNEPAKTVAFNVSNDTYHHAPTEENSVQFTYEKAQKEDNTEEVAFAVAQAVAMKNPMYARSENVTNGSYSYTVKQDPTPEPQFKEFNPLGSADFGYRRNDAPAELEVERTMLSPEPERYEEPEEYSNFEMNEAPAEPAYYQPAPVESAQPSYYEEPKAEAPDPTYQPTPAPVYQTPERPAPTYQPTGYATERRDSERVDISETFSVVDEEPEVMEEPDNSVEGFTWTEDLATPLDFDDEEENVDEAITGFESVEDEDEPDEIPLEEQNPEVIKLREQFSFLREEDAAQIQVSSSEEDEEEPEDEPEEEPIEEEEDDEPPFEPVRPVARPMPPAPIEKKEEKPKADYTNYKLPSVDMLVSPPVEEYDYSEETQENANRLIGALESFNVTASIKGVDRGPRITRYEVVPARGVKVSSVMNLQDDIALALAANSIRMEAPIPGKSAIGVEIPNSTSNIVYLRDLVETTDFQNNPSKTAICIGKDVAGAPVFGDIAKMPHLLVAGATGMGKSVCINSFMISLLYKAKPDEVKFIMIDPKKVEFKRYNGIPHLLVPVVAESKQAAGSLMWAVGEMERRYGLIESLYVSNIDMYNAKVKENPSLGEFLPRIVIVIDEFADLMLQVKDPVEKLVMSLAQKARAAGIHLIIGTQRPAVSVITGTIKANIPSRISCKVASYTDSRTVLECAGAEKLLDKGDMLFASPGAIKPIRVQGAFVSDGELERILNYVKEQAGGANYDNSVLDEINKAAQKCAKKSGDLDDDDDGDHDDYAGEGYLNNKQFLDSVEIAVNQGQISTSLLQRKISIGFGKAAKFIDIMEDMGIVGEKNGTKPRQVLITKEEWREKLARTTYDDF